jgi:hypothetical protein
MQRWAQSVFSLCLFGVLCELVLSGHDALSWFSIRTDPSSQDVHRITKRVSTFEADQSSRFQFEFSRTEVNIIKFSLFPHIYGDHRLAVRTERALPLWRGQQNHFFSLHGYF